MNPFRHYSLTEIMKLPRFNQLPMGARFTFPTAHAAEERAVYTKTSKSGWYRDARGKAWRTGAQTAVVEIPASLDR
jgi:hypothetical protein